MTTKFDHSESYPPQPLQLCLDCGRSNVRFIRHLSNPLLLLPTPFQFYPAEVNGNFGLLNPLTDAEMDDGLVYGVQKAHSMYNFVGSTVDVVFHPVKPDSASAALSQTDAFAMGPAYYNNTADLTCYSPASYGLLIPADALSCFSLPIDRLLYKNTFRLKFSGTSDGPVDLYSWAFIEEELGMGKSQRGAKRLLVLLIVPLRSLV